MQEEMNLEQNAEVYESISAEENADDVTQEETIEYIDVKEQELYVIEVEEAFASTVEGDELNHALLNNRDLPGQHPIGAIDGLENILAEIQSLKSGLYASSGGLAEFRKWEDENPSWENRSGYFVSVVNGDGDIAICDKQVNDVYGVTVSSSAICGYQESVNKSGNPTYSMVCLVGNVKVRISEDADIVAGDYVIADNYGYAIKSENNVGFRVLLVGTDPVLDHYVSIALVPQNDNVSRVMEELNTTNGELSNAIIQLGKMEDALVEVERNSSNAVEVAEDAKGLADMLKETVGSMGVQLENVTDIANRAKDSAEKAIVDANAIYTDATATANNAKDVANNALGGINDLKTDLTPLAEWTDGTNTGIVGFVAQASADHTELSELVEKYGENVTDIIAIKKKIDENGAAIENLVAHADRYSIGPRSLTYSLTYDEAIGIMRDGHIYVATEEHTEILDEDSYEFKSGGVYKWYTENEKSVWLDTGKTVAFYTTETVGTNIDDLWYCLGSIRDENNQLIYHPETLYRWDGIQWISVATIDGNLQARTLGLVKQTANELTSTYTNLRGDVSVMKQTVDEISTTVSSVEGEISSINQAADSIIAGTFDPEGSSSLSMLLDYSFTAVSEGRYHTRINSFLGTTTVVGNRYTQPPSWSETEGKFVFNESCVDPGGKYYFNSDNQTTYCKDVKNGYEVYTIGNTAISALDSRVSETESEMDSWTRFKTGTNETMTSISQSASEDGADIASVVYGNYRQCLEIKTELTEEERNAIPTDRYVNAPNYVDSMFVFDGIATPDGKYYMLDGDDVHYYKVVNPDGEIIGYEKYTMKASNYASIMQKVDENGSVIGLVANNNDVEGGIFVTAINNSTTALISADKIGINGTAIFKDNLNDGSTTISGNYIRSGILQSNYYKIPTEITTPFAEAGTKFDLDVGTINSKNFNIDANGNVDINGNVTIGGNINMDGSITLGGSIALNGSISWRTDNSPVLVLYAQSELTKPVDKFDENGEVNDGWKEYQEYDKSLTSVWHRICSTSDYYASYSYDGGMTWTVTIRIRGKNGSDGSDAKVPDYIQETCIDFTSISSPNIYGGRFATSSEGTAYTTMVNNEFAIYDINTATPKASLGYDPDDSGGLIELVLGAGWQGNTHTIDVFKISKDDETATLSYQAGDNTAYTITFSHSGIAIDGLITGVTAVFG